MNERIKELELQAYVEVTQPWRDPSSGYVQEITTKEFSREKFAELLIEECCDMVNKHHQYNNPNDCLLVLDIKDRFGVE